MNNIKLGKCLLIDLFYSLCQANEREYVEVGNLVQKKIPILREDCIYERNGN
jgi:hypothetical protein